MSLAREIREMIYELYMLPGGEAIATANKDKKAAPRVKFRARADIEPWYSGSAPRLALKSGRSPLTSSQYHNGSSRASLWVHRNLEAFEAKRGLLDYYDRDENGQLCYRDIVYFVYALAEFEGRVLDNTGKWVSTMEDRKALGALQDFLQFFWSKTVVDLHQVWTGQQKQAKKKVSYRIISSFGFISSLLQ